MALFDTVVTPDFGVVGPSKRSDVKTTEVNELPPDLRRALEARTGREITTDEDLDSARETVFLQLTGSAATKYQSAEAGVAVPVSLPTPEQNAAKINEAFGIMETGYSICTDYPFGEVCKTCQSMNPAGVLGQTIAQQRNLAQNQSIFAYVLDYALRSANASIIGQLANCILNLPVAVLGTIASKAIDFAKLGNVDMTIALSGAVAGNGGSMDYGLVYGTLAKRMPQTGDNMARLMGSAVTCGYDPQMLVKRQVANSTQPVIDLKTFSSMSANNTGGMDTLLGRDNRRSVSALAGMASARTDGPNTPSGRSDRPAEGALAVWDAG